MGLRGGVRVPISKSRLKPRNRDDANRVLKQSSAYKNTRPTPSLPSQLSTSQMSPSSPSQPALSPIPTATSSSHDHTTNPRSLNPYWLSSRSLYTSPRAWRCASTAVERHWKDTAPRLRVTAKQSPGRRSAGPVPWGMPSCRLRGSIFGLRGYCPCMRMETAV